MIRFQCVYQIMTNWYRCGDYSLFVFTIKRCCLFYNLFCLCCKSETFSPIDYKLQKFFHSICSFNGASCPLFFSANITNLFHHVTFGVILRIYNKSALILVYSAKISVIPMIVIKTMLGLLNFPSCVCLIWKSNLQTSQR